MMAQAAQAAAGAGHLDQPFKAQQGQQHSQQQPQGQQLQPLQQQAPPQQFQLQRRQLKQPQPCCSYYNVEFGADQADTPAVPYVHVRAPAAQRASSSPAVAAAAAAVAAAAAAAATPYGQRDTTELVLGKGGCAVVYLLEQQQPCDDNYPAQVALKVPYAGREGDSEREHHMSWRLAADEPCVVQLLGTAQGSSDTGQEVMGLVYEYCPGQDLKQWAKGEVQRAAQRPEVQQRMPTVVQGVLADFVPGLQLPSSWEEQLQANGDNADTVMEWETYARMEMPLRQLALEEPLKRQMRGLLGLVVRMSGGGGAGSHPSATRPAGGLVFHNDIKPGNICLSSNDAAKLVDWGMASNFPSATCTAAFRPPGLTPT
jgi:hypothetical protein